MAVSEKLIDEFKTTVKGLEAVKAEIQDDRDKLGDRLDGQEKTLAKIRRQLEPNHHVKSLQRSGDYTGAWQKGDSLLDDEQRAAFLEYMMMAFRNEKAQLLEFAKHRYEGKAIKDITETPGSVGVLVPTEFYPAIIRAVKGASLYLQEAPSIPMNRLKMTMPADNQGWAVQIAAEGSQIPVSDLVIVSAELVAIKVAAYSRISSEALEDSVIDLVDYIIMAGGEAIGQMVDQIAFTEDTTKITDFYGVGTLSTITPGSGDPTPKVQRIGAAVTNLTYGALADGLGQLETYRRQGLKWYMSPQTYSQVLKLEDTANRPLWGTTIQGQPPTILGYPVVLTDHMASTGANKTVILLGNLANLPWGDRRNVTVKTTDAERLQYDQTSLLMTARYGFLTGWYQTDIVNRFVSFATNV